MDSPGFASGPAANRPARGLSVAALLALALSLAGCGCATAVRPAGVLQQALEQEPLSLDPALWSDVVGGRIISLISSPLVRAGPSGTVLADLAERWEISGGGRLYTFHLDPRARFTNGRKVTARDVKYSFERVLDPRTRAPRTWVLEPILGAAERLAGSSDSISGIRTPDDATVALELAHPFAPFLEGLELPVAGVVPREEVERLGPGFSTHPVGSGPFSLVSWTRGGSLELAANAACHLGKPKLAGMRFRVIQEPLTRSSEFQLGNLDVLAIPPNELGFYSRHPVWGSRIQSAPGLNVYYLGLACRRPPTSDVRVRRAIAMAIDRKGILQSVRKGLGVEAAGPIPPGVAGHDPAFLGLPYDPEGARKLLVESGHAGGFELELAQSDSRENLEVTEILASYLARIGIRARLASYEWQTFRARVAAGAAQSWFLSWWGEYPDADYFLYPLFHSSQAGSGGNGPRYASPRVDAMLERMRSLPSPRERAKLAAELEKTAVGDASRVFLYHKLDLIVTQPWVRGLTLAPTYTAARYVEVSMDEAARNRGLEAAGR